MSTTKMYQFTLVLKNVNENTSHLEDSFFEAGCSDALIHSKNGAIYLEFDRESFSLEEAVISAINDVQSSSVGAKVVSVAPENFVTESEIARRLNRPRQTISLWIKGQRRNSFPHPVMRLAKKSSLWKWNEVVDWLYENKLIEDDELVESALFFANINAALEELDSRARKIRHHLLHQISLHG